MAPHRLAILFAASLIAAGCGSPATEKPSAPAAGPVGIIRGAVHLVGNAPAAASEKINADQTTCGASVSLPRIALGKDNGVKDAFVYIEGVPSVANATPPASASVLVDQKNCQYLPHAMTVPVGTELEITNSDSILHNVHGTVVGSDGFQTIFNIAQPIKGQKGKTPALAKPGVVYLTCEAGHPWMSSFVFVSENPYVAITKDDGDFVLANVSVGTYKIKMWHEGVTLKENNKTLQRYEYEDPYETTQDVVVTANGEVVVNFDFTLRPGKK